MSDTLMCAVLALIGTIVSGLLSTWISNKLVNYRLDLLEKKVDKHNNLIERTYQIEKDIALIKEDIAEIKNK